MHSEKLIIPKDLTYTDRTLNNRFFIDKGKWIYDRYEIIKIELECRGLWWADF